MGSVGSTDQSCILLNMKFLVVVSALLAAAYADADAEALYHPFGYGLGLSYGYKSAPLVNAANAHYNNYYNGAFPYRTFGYRAAYPAYTGYAAGYTGYTGFTGYRHLIGK